MAQLKLLVVEDDPASLELMTEVFTSLKTDVRAIGDSRKASGERGTIRRNFSGYRNAKGCGSCAFEARA
jgi:hypothetical protein